jgi:hypothetical protein
MVPEKANFQFMFFTSDRPVAKPRTAVARIVTSRTEMPALVTTSSSSREK